MEIVFNDQRFDIGIAGESDVPALAFLAHSWAGEMDYQVSTDEIKADLLRVMRDGVVIVAREQDEVIGMMTGVAHYHFWVHEKIAHEHWFFVRPDKRRGGLGDLFQEAFSAWGKANGCGSVIINPNRFGSVAPEKIAAHLATKGFELHGMEMRRKL